MLWELSTSLEKPEMQTTLGVEHFARETRDADVVDL